LHISKRAFLKTVVAASMFPVVSKSGFAGDWTALVAEAKGQTVFFNAWAGSEAINAYIAWAGEQVKTRFGITLNHVKITDAAELVRRVRDEVKAGAAQGSADLVWINGENFRAMKADKLLFGPFATTLPNFKYVDVEGKPTTLVDFAEPTDGLESPWGMAQLTFFGDGVKISKPPQSMTELVEFAKANPGRRSVLAQPATKESLAAVSAPMFALLDALRPHLWREGKQYPQSQAQLKQMLADGELIMALTFNPNDAANLIATKELPVTTISWQYSAGTIGNTHFVAIPVNSKSTAAAQLVADFLISPEAQARKADLKTWGDPTVLAMAKLSTDEAKLFAGGDVPGSVKAPAPAIPEPHGSWVPLIEAAWLEHYGA
jgi:putative thiamine transport system substrate-binding protein